MADEHTWPQLLTATLGGSDLSAAQTTWAMSQIMDGIATPAQIAAFAVGLRAKGETAEELVGLAEAMLARAVRVRLPSAVHDRAIDVVGTGGDRAQTVNISTMAAVVVAGAGVPVVKHGNRAASSACGAADLLEHLGLPLHLSAAQVVACVQQVGIGFCFAPAFHSGLRHAAATRRELGVPTAFNVLGPLTNPAQPPFGAVGCADERMAPLLADVFSARKASVLVMRGEDGLDEFTTAAPTQVWQVRDGAVTRTVVDAAQLGLPRSSHQDLRGADAAHNAQVARDVLTGRAGPVRDAVLLNAAAAWAAQSPSGGSLPDALRAGLDRARESIDSGAAEQVLQRWIAYASELIAATPLTPPVGGRPVDEPPAPGR